MSLIKHQNHNEMFRGTEKHKSYLHASWKRWVFKSILNVLKLTVFDMMYAGSLFQILGVEVKSAESPKVYCIMHMAYNCILIESQHPGPGLWNPQHRSQKKSWTAGKDRKKFWKNNYGALKCLFWSLNMAKTYIGASGGSVPGPPARGLASGSHQFGGLWQAPQTSNLTENIFILVYAPRQQFFSMSCSELQLSCLVFHNWVDPGSWSYASDLHIGR